MLSYVYYESEPDPLSEAKRTSLRTKRMSRFDLGCVKTQKIEKRRELFFSDRVKANTLTNSRADYCNPEKRSFYHVVRSYVFTQPRPEADIGGIRIIEVFFR